MADMIPIKVNPTVGDTISLGEFQATDSVGIDNGGTGAVTAAGARTNLDVYSTAEVDALVGGGGGGGLSEPYYGGLDTGFNINSANTTIPFTTLYDPNTNASNGVYTVPSTGNYLVLFSMHVQHYSASVGNVSAYARLNITNKFRALHSSDNGVSNATVTTQGVISATAGDTISIRTELADSNNVIVTHNSYYTNVFIAKID